MEVDPTRVCELLVGLGDVEVLGGDVDVISAGGLKDKHRGILEDAITL